MGKRAAVPNSRCSSATFGQVTTKTKPLKVIMIKRQIRVNDVSRDTNDGKSFPHKFLTHTRKGGFEVKKNKPRIAVRIRSHPHGKINIQNVGKHAATSDKTPLRGRDPLREEWFSHQTACAGKQSVRSVNN